MLSGAATDHNLLTDLTVGQLLGIVVTLGAIIGLIRSVSPIMKRLNNLLDDWAGEKARPGVEERLGVMPRLAENHQMLVAQGAAIKAQDKVLAEHGETLSHLRKTVEPLVDETAAGNHKEVLQKLEDISKSSNANAGKLANVETLLARHIRESKTWVKQVDDAAAAVDFKLPPWPDMPE